MQVQLWIDEQSLWKAMKYADKQWVDQLVICGEKEVAENEYVIKNMKTWEEKKIKM